MSLRSHSNAGDQPPAPMASPGRSANGNRLELPRHGPEAEISPVKPACRISSWHFATINAPYRTLPSEQVPPAIARTSSRFRAARLTAPPVLASTTVSRGPSRPRSIAEQKASQSLPALEALVPNRQCRHPRGGGPEVFLVVHVPGFSCDHRRALLKRTKANRAPSRHPMPCHCSRHPLSTRSTQRAAVFALLGSPRAFAHKLDTALDFRSGANPYEWMALRLQYRSNRWREGKT